LYPPISNINLKAAAFPISPYPDGTRLRRSTFRAPDFLDLQGEFSEQSIELHFMMPTTAQLEAAFGRHGIGANSPVVLYTSAVRCGRRVFWWMLRSLGF